MRAATRAQDSARSSLSGSYRPVWRRYYILSALESENANTHSASVHIYDRDGFWVSSLHPGVELTPENFAHDVRLALSGS
jgi:hypothetical protein